MNGVMIERLVYWAALARAAEHGKRAEIYEQACAELRISRRTLSRKLREVGVVKGRKQRADHKETALTRDEMLIISGVLMESTRQNGKRLFSIEGAVDALRRDGKINAGRVDEDTGEFIALSASSISRALKLYGLHPDQLMAPAPATELASLHPNHVWELDASICVLYYLRNGNRQTKNTGLQIMERDKFYKNKPKNVAKIVNDRVWSFELTDHTSGWIYVEYLLGAESSENFCSVLINAMQDRGGADVLHGVPKVLFTDPGAALTAPLMRNLCHALGIELITHKARNARATGSVEKARDIIECNFEPGLKFQPVNSLDELNALAKKWRSHFNATRVHSRTGKSRNDVWLTINHEQLIKAPSIDDCRELAVAAPESRKVTAKLRVPFQGAEYDVSSVPGVMVGERLMITRNPWRSDAAQAVITGEDGHETFHVIPAIEKNDYGFATTAAVIGQEYQRHSDTPAQTAAKEVEQLLTGTDSVEAAAAARKAKTLPFGGDFNPYREIEEAQYPTYLPKRGQASPVQAPRIERQPLNSIKAAQALRSIFQARGENWLPEHYQLLVQQYPNGIQEEQLNTVAEALLDAGVSNVVSIAKGHRGIA